MSDATLIPNAPAVTPERPELSTMTERELLEEMVANTRAVRDLIGEVSEKVSPTLEKLGKNPMFKILGIG